MSDCIGEAAGVQQRQVEPLSISVTRPTQVAPDEVFTIRISPDEGLLPDKAFNQTVGEVTVLGLQNIKLMFNLPTNSVIEDLALVPDTTYNTSGPYSVGIDTSFTPNRIVLSVGQVVKNPVPPANDTPFKLPSFDVTLRATGPIGSNINTRVAGFNRPTSGYTFTALNSIQAAAVDCWPEGEVPAPLLSQTVIAPGGGQTTPTTTELTVEPTLVPGGNEVSMTASVSAPSGIVQFNDGPTILGYAPLDDESVARLSAPLNYQLGNETRPITATFTGSAGFESSTSAPVAVTVTDPSIRNRPQVVVTAAPPVNLGTTGTEGTTNVTVTVSPTSDGPAPTGLVRLFDNGVPASSVGEAGILVPFGPVPLVGGVAVFEGVRATLGGHQYRADYVGDTNYHAQSGSVPVAAKNTTAAGSNTAERALTAALPLTLNGASRPTMPPTSTLAASFRTDATGAQDLSGTLAFGSTTYDTAFGTVTGQLAQVGEATGQILPGGATSLKTNLFFQVASGDFGGNQVFASTCAIGPFEVNFSGNRAAGANPIPLAASNFNIPFPAANSCVNELGVSFANQIGGVFAGGATNLAFTAAAAPPAVATTVSPVQVTPAAGTSFGEPVTLSATVSNATATNFPAGAGRVDFYANGVLVDGGNTPSGNSPTKTVTVTLPRSAQTVPLPQGTLSLQAEYVPSNAQKLNFATSPKSSPATYQVLPPIPKTVPTVTLEVPETAAAGEPVELNIEISPAPNTVTAPAPPLTGVLEVIDDSGDSAKRIKISSPANNSAEINVTAASDGQFTVRTALAPGVHSLRAVFTPSVPSAWWWGTGESEPHTHEVVGEAIPTSLSVVSDSTRGTGQVPIGANFYPTVQIDPRVVATAGPFSAYLQGQSQGFDAGLAFNASGQVQWSVSPNDLSLGPNEVTLLFDPGFDPLNNFIVLSNQGFAPSELTIPLEVVDPTVTGPMPMGLEITAVAPNRVANPPVLAQSVPIPANTPWGLDGYVSYVGTGNPNGGKVDYIARNLATAEITALGTAGVRPGTGAADRGRASIPSNAQSGHPLVGAAPGLPAGTYEIIGTYTPNSPTLYQPTTSDAFILHVVGDDKVETTTTLSVTPSGTSSPGQGVLLEADVSPVWASAGTVEFRDDDEPLGSQPVVGGYASLLVFDLEPGEHELSAVFTPADTDVVEGSSSDLIPHLVADPAIPTITELTIEPEGTSLQGQDVTLTATVAAEDPEADGAPEGTVFFEDEHGVLGEVDLEEGLAELILDDLEPGTHEIVAVFVPDPDSDFAGSASEVVEHEVIAQNAPAPPLDVSAAPGGLMAIVTWDPPEDDGGQPVSGYTVYISSGEEPEEWDFPVAETSAAVTTVDVIGLEADVDYSFKVTAHNSVGESELSEVSNTVTVAPPEHEFTDVSPGDDFFNEITWMAETGLSTGFEPGPEYRPTISITRQAMSAFVYRINGSPLGPDPQCETAPFPDVSVDNDFCGEIAWMADEGITTGNSDGTFNPTGAVSRQAMSAFLYRSANGPDTPAECTVAPFTDVPADDQFCPYISWMKDTGISTGDPEGTFRPTLPVTRMAMSAFLYRYTLVVPTTVV